jgi:hypothetical protein
MASPKPGISIFQAARAKNIAPPLGRKTAGLESPAAFAVFRNIVISFFALFLPSMSGPPRQYRPSAAGVRLDRVIESSNEAFMNRALLLYVSQGRGFTSHPI